MEDLTGKQLNQYQIVAPLGQGGMASVYKAYQPSMERYIALKILPRHLATDPQFMGRFEQEAKVIANLQHPHILPVFDYGEADGYTYIAMPFIETGTLSDILRGMPLPIDRIRSIISQIGDALDYAHSRGIVHRDIKPSNILIDQRGNCLLADFGIAKMMEGTAEFTKTGGIVGTPAYMSPEQGLGDIPDGRSDIYSLGVILYEMATGRPPYNAETPMAIVIKHIHDPLPLPRSINPQISDDLERVILKALSKKREERYATAGQFVQAIQALKNNIPEKSTLVANRSMPEVTITAPPVATQIETPIPIQITPTYPQEQRKSNWKVWILAIMGVSGVGILTLLMGWLIIGLFTRDSSENAAALLASHTASPILTETQLATQTSEPLPSETVTPVPTDVPTFTPEPALGIGDTLVSTVDGSVMVYVPAGEFLLGASEADDQADPDEFPQVSVYLDAFWIDQFEVTNRQYQACVKAGACAPPNATDSASRITYYGDPEYDDYPVVNVDWVDASDYCVWRDARLPTEAEWEKAARGPSGWLYPWGDTFEPNHSNDCAGSILCPSEPDDGYSDTAPVGSFPSGASPYQVYDMAGNANEWVADWYAENYYATLTDGVANPTGPHEGTERVIRGGSLGLNPSKLRVTNRGAEKPAHYGPYDGFRCAQSPDL
jgi:serine/threonine protein kinase